MVALALTVFALLGAVALVWLLRISRGRRGREVDELLFRQEEIWRGKGKLVD